jgi:hypothetical protein
VKGSAIGYIRCRFATESYTGAERGREEGEGRRMSGTGTTAYPHRRRPIYHRLPMRTTTSTCGSGAIRVLHPDDANGGWCRFAGAGNTSSVRNLDIDKVGAVIIMVIIVVERTKLSRREEVDFQLKRRSVKAREFAIRGFAEPRVGKSRVWTRTINSTNTFIYCTTIGLSP